MTWGNFKEDSVSEAYKKMKAEELKGNQHKLDKNKNGKLDGHDFKLLRKEDAVEEGVNKSDIPTYKRPNDKLTLADLEKERTQNKSHADQLAKNNGTKKEETEVSAEELVEYEAKDGVYKHQAKAGRYGGSEKESDYVKGPSDAELKKIEAEKKKKVNEAKEGDTVTIHKPGHPLHGLTGHVYHSGNEHATIELHDKPKDHAWQSTRNVQIKHDELKVHESVEKEGLDLFSDKEIDSLISEVLKASDDAGKWISDFTKSDDPRFSGDSKEQRKKRALAAYYAAQKKESVDYDSFLEEATQGDIVKMNAKAIKHGNVEDKDDEKDVMEPNSEGEADFLDKHSVQVTDEPAAAAGNDQTGKSKVSTATGPKGQGAGKYDGKGKTGIKEDSDEEASISEAKSCGCKEDCSCKESTGKKSYTTFKEKMNKKGC